jgi:signal transduction histidine kinase/ligand-binding sensor domain-containing protein
MAKILKIAIVLLFFVLGFSEMSFSQRKVFKFSHLTVAQGLPENSVLSIQQDKAGFMWFGTQNGLVRHDGYNLKSYKPNKKDNNTISSEIITSLLVSRNGTLWIGTSYGLNRYNKESDNFSVYHPDTINILKGNLIEKSLYLIHEDSEGCLWIVTGKQFLLKFDPKLEKFFYPDFKEGNQSSILNLRIFAPSFYLSTFRSFSKYSIYEDEEKNMWFGTIDGLYKYNNSSNTVMKMAGEGTDFNSLSSGKVTQIIKASGNGLLIGTYGGGLNFYDKSTGKFKWFRHETYNSNSLLCDSIINLYRDMLGRVWISTLQGIDCYDESADKFIHFKPDPENPDCLCKPIAIPILEEKNKGEIWFLTRRNGIEVLDINSGLFSHCKNSISDIESISSNIISAIYKDLSGTLWIGTSWSGLNKMKDLSYIPFEHLQNDKLDPNSLTDDYITFVKESPFKKNVFWIGTDKGLNYYDKNKKIFISYSTAKQHSINADRVFDAYEDKKGILWIATYEGGLNRFDLKKNSFIYYKNNPDDTTTISNDNVRVIHEDRKGNLWIGTSGGGINIMNIKTGKFKRYMKDRNNPYSIDDNNILCIFEDKAGTIWVGTNIGGLNKYLPEKDGFYSYLGKTDSLECISAIYEDSKSRMWIGTYRYGLHLFDREKSSSTIFTEKDGLLQNSVSGIQEDEKGRLWLFTDRGISCFTPETKLFRNYDASYDIYFKGYLRTGCSYKSSLGELFVGSSNGIYSFFPDKVNTNPFPPKTVITDIKINDNALSFYNNLSIYKNASVLKEITLLYWQNIISIEFSALHYNIPEKNHYQYYLENLDTGWRDAGYNHFANYTNLDPGRYIFHVRAANCDGLWNYDSTDLIIIIKPPFWKTWWFRIFIFVLILGSIFFIYRVRVKYLTKQTNELEKQVNERTKEINEQKESLKQKNTEIEYTNAELHKMNDMVGEQNTELKILNEDLNSKNNQIAHQNEALKYLVDEKNEFLGMIAHDLRNPLFVILGSADLLLRGIKEKKYDESKLNKDLERIKTATTRMKRFIEDILQIASIESAKIRLEPEKTDYLIVLTDIVEFYKRLAEEKSIKIEFTKSENDESIILTFDPSRIIQVLENILSNAIKFTSPGGTIKVSYCRKDNKVFTYIEDSGQGIEQDELPFLFKGSKKLSSKPTGGETSTGLGLVIVKKIIEMHNGEVFAESEKGKGSRIFFSLNIN